MIFQEKLISKVKRKLIFYKKVIINVSQILGILDNTSKKCILAAFIDRGLLFIPILLSLDRIAKTLESKIGIASEQRSQDYPFFTNNIFQYSQSKHSYKFIYFGRITSRLIKTFNGGIKEIFIDKIYEQDEVNLGRGDIVLDCGANIGMFSVYASSKIGKNGRIFAFEPGLVEVKSLSENIKINKCSNVKIIPLGLSDKKEVKSFIIKDSFGNYVLENREEINFINKPILQINTIDIDTFVREKKLTRIDFIKMDIEGLEAKALMGAKKTILKYKPKLAISLYHKPEDFCELPNLIKKLDSDYKIKIRNKNNTLIAYAY